MVGTFADDDRVLACDLWNEPDIPGGGSYKDDQKAGEIRRITTLLPKIFAWARSRRPTQPLTSGVWAGDDWSPGAPSLNDIQKTQLSQSDVITLHDYSWPESFENRIAQLRPYGRPIICTEWLARSAGSTLDAILPIAHREGVGMINWGFVQGKIKTHLPWDSWDHPYVEQQPTVWFHDLLRKDGTPYRPREAEVFLTLRRGAARAHGKRTLSPPIGRRALAAGRTGPRQAASRRKWCVHRLPLGSSLPCCEGDARGT